MKKKIVKLIGVVAFAVVLLLNISIGSSSNSNSKIGLENLEALACYTLEVNDNYLWDCCYPWIDGCYWMPGISLKGTITTNFN